MNLIKHGVLMAAALILCGAAIAQPTFQSASPTAGTATSEKANANADKAMYQAIQYQNAGKQGPALVVIPGEIKSSNATFTQKFGPTNIADFAEIELSRANFQVLERTNLVAFPHEASEKPAPLDSPSRGIRVALNFCQTMRARKHGSEPYRFRKRRRRDRLGAPGQSV